MKLFCIVRVPVTASESPRCRLFPGVARALHLALIGLLIMVGRVACNAGPVSRECQVKAAFLYNFAKFIQWPAQTFASADSPIVIGVLGQNPISGELEKAVQGRKINGRGIIVRQVESVAAARQTQILFVDSTQENSLDEFMGALKGAPVVTVGESDSFARHGGMITFIPQGDKLRFAINVAPAENSGVKISAQLQKLATEIRRE